MSIGVLTPVFAQNHLFDDPGHLGISDGEENVPREGGSLEASPESGPPWMGHSWRKSTVRGRASQVSAFSPPQSQSPLSLSPDQSWLSEQGDSVVEAGTAGAEAGILLE